MPHRCQSLVWLAYARSRERFNLGSPLVKFRRELEKRDFRTSIDDRRRESAAVVSLFTVVAGRVVRHLRSSPS